MQSGSEVSPGIAMAFSELEKTSALTIEKTDANSAKSIQWSTFIGERSKPEIILLHEPILEVISALPADILDTCHFVALLENRNKKNNALKVGIRSWLCFSDISDAPIALTLEAFTAHGTHSGISALAKSGEYLITHRILDQKDVGWLGDVVFHFYQNAFNKSLLSINRLRPAITALLGSIIPPSGLTEPMTIGLSLLLKPEALTLGLRIPYDPKKSDQTTSILDPRSITWAPLCSGADYLGIIDLPELKEIEIHAQFDNRLRSTAGGTCFFLSRSRSEIFKEFESETKLATPRRIDTITDELPPELRLGFGPLGKRGNSTSASSSADQEEAVAQIIGRKNKLIDQLSTRVEHEQLASQERNRRLSELVNSTKIELESTKKELSSLRLKVRSLERESESAKVADDLDKGQDTEKALTDVNLALKAANSGKASAEDKFQLSERKVSILEKKFAKAIKELQQRERELSDSKPIILKLSKELENAQAQIKAQTAQAPIQVNNEEYEKKIKALSAKLFEFQQKEHDLQMNLKKVNLKLEQQEIGRKSTKDQSEGKVKILEKQLEQAKAKEKDFLKKIEELNGLLKKAKSGKAA